MAQDVDWIAEAPRRGFLSRFLAPEATARPSVSAFVVGILAAATFVLALTWQWQSVRLPPQQQDGRGDGTPPDLVLNTAVSSPELLGLVYVLGTLVLLAVVGAVVNRSDLALRVRVAATAASVGLLGVVVGIMKLAPSVLSERLGAFMLPREFEVSHQPGLLFALVSVVLPAVAIWLAARPAAGMASAPQTGHFLADGHEEATTIAPQRTVPAGSLAPADFRVVRPGEALDLTVTPER